MDLNSAFVRSALTCWLSFRRRPDPGGWQSYNSAPQTPWLWKRAGQKKRKTDGMWKRNWMDWKDMEGRRDEREGRGEEGWRETQVGVAVPLDFGGKHAPNCGRLRAKTGTASWWTSRRAHVAKSSVCTACTGSVRDASVCTFHRNGFFVRSVLNVAPRPSCILLRPAAASRVRIWARLRNRQRRMIAGLHRNAHCMCTLFCCRSTEPDLSQGYFRIAMPLW